MKTYRSITHTIYPPNYTPPTNAGYNKWAKYISKQLEKIKR